MSCEPGKSITKAIITSSPPFSGGKGELYNIHEVYGSHFQSVDGKKHYKINMKDEGRGNVTVNICESGGTRPYRTTEAYGCKKTILFKTTKRGNASKIVNDFIDGNNLFVLPDAKHKKDLFEMGAKPSHQRLFIETDHCAKKLTKDYERNWALFRELEEQLKDEYHYATWGDTDRNVPEINAKKGDNIMEWRLFERKKWII
jgi:hypothetical protein